jgi:hypothetical protein
VPLRTMDINRSPVARARFKIRGAILRGDPDRIEGPRALLAWMESQEWGLLAEVPGRELVLGTVMRPWEADPSP